MPEMQEHFPVGAWMAEYAENVGALSGRFICQLKRPECVRSTCAPAIHADGRADFRTQRAAASEDPTNHGEA